MPIEKTSYVPTLAIRPSEMRGLEYLPSATQTRMTPCVLLAPWSSSRSIASAVERFEKAYPHGIYFLDIDRDYAYSNPDAPAQLELAQLNNPANNYQAWCDFVAGFDRIMPCLQLRDQSEAAIRDQIARYRDMGRNFALRIFRDREQLNLNEAVAALAAEGAADFVVIMEGGWSRDALQLPAWFSGIMNNTLAPINAQVPYIASCTTMPKAFSQYVGRSEVAFANRVLVQQVQALQNSRRVIYGDWASTRPRDGRTGGGGVEVPPRIDYPRDDAWWIFRNPEAWTFQRAAAELVEDAAVWDGSTGQWGEQMIAETAVSEHLGVDTLQKNVSVRVNLHLHRQAFYGTDLPPMEDLEDDWED